MPNITLVFSVLYIALGVAAYQLTGAMHKTALIPAYLGAALLVLGLLGRRPEFRRHAMHAALVVGLVALLGTVTSLPKLPEALAGQGKNPAAIQARAATAVLSFAFLAFGIRSFIQARRSRSS